MTSRDDKSRGAGMQAAMAWTRTYTDPEPSRVNKWLGQSGVCSRREADSLIAQGLVSIDGEVVTDAGRKIAAGQTLTLNDSATEGLDAALSVVLNKPAGIVSAQPEPGQIPAARLLTRERLWGLADAVPFKDSSLPPLGRLDMESRGLLLLSEDGVLAKALIGPQSGLEKEYLVRVNGEITREKIALLTHGLELDDRKLKPAKVTLNDERQLRIILTEGRNRQIRRMCSLVRLAVTDLYRIRIGPLHLDNLPEGRWRPLTADERTALISG